MSLKIYASVMTLIMGLSILSLVYLPDFRFHLKYRSLKLPLLKDHRLNRIIANAESRDEWNETSNFEFYVRYTANGNFKQQADTWLLKTMHLFIPRYLADIVVVLDNEKQEDHVYGDQLAKHYPTLSTRLCYMAPYPIELIHNWGHIRMYIDMLYADTCTSKEYVGFVDVDTLFITAVTNDLLFENGKPIVSGRIGHPTFPCWIQTAEFILGVKQVMQCMGYFPVIFKVAHIIELRAYVEKLHKKPFKEVFSRATFDLKIEGWCYCHYSLLCNYVWYHHRDEYAWHLQWDPDGKWNGEGWIPSMVNVNYFRKEIKENEKVPIARSSLHIRHYAEFGVPKPPSKELVSRLIKEGLCYSFGFSFCPENCAEFNPNQMHDALFAFEAIRWQWDSRCAEAEKKHYTAVKDLVKRSPDQFNVDLKNKTSFCNLLSKFG